MIIRKALKSIPARLGCQWSLRRHSTAWGLFLSMSSAWISEPPCGHLGPLSANQPCRLPLGLGFATSMICELFVVPPPLTHKRPHVCSSQYPQAGRQVTLASNQVYLGVGYAQSSITLPTSDASFPASLQYSQQTATGGVQRRGAGSGMDKRFKECILSRGSWVGRSQRTSLWVSLGSTGHVKKPLANGLVGVAMPQVGT